MGLNPKVLTWSQRVCEQIETQFTELFAALSTMPDIADVHIPADYTGTVDPAQFPVTVPAYRYTNTTDNTADAAWSFTTDTGGITASISNGILTITAITATTQVTVTSVYSGVTKSRTFTVYLDVASPPATGTSGSATTVSDTSFATFNSTTMAAVSDELTVVAGSGGKVTLSAPLTVYTSAVSPTGTFPVRAIWRQWNGVAYVDVATETSSSPDCYVVAFGMSYGTHPGSIAVSQTVTGLTAGTSYKFQLYLRNSSGTRTMALSGTASAVGS